MRTFFAQVETRYRAIKNCPFTPAHVVKVFGGYMCGINKQMNTITKI